MDRVEYDLGSNRASIFNTITNTITFWIVILSDYLIVSLTNFGIKNIFWDFC